MKEVIVENLYLIIMFLLVILSFAYFSYLKNKFNDILKKEEKSENKIAKLKHLNEKMWSLFILALNYSVINAFILTGVTENFMKYILPVILSFYVSTKIGRESHKLEEQIRKEG